MKSNQNLHAAIGDYLREIDKIQREAIKRKKEVSKVNLNKIQAFRKMIMNASETLQKGMGW